MARLRSIEVEEGTADRLEARAAERGISLSELLADLALDGAPLVDAGAWRAAGEGPWSAEVLAEDERRLAVFERTGEGVPWEEAKAWMESWWTPDELPPPEPRKL